MFQTTSHKGYLNWIPESRHFDEKMRPYTATIRAWTQEKKGYCTGPGFGEWKHCETKVVEVPIEIGVTWGDLPEPRQEAFSGANADLSINGSAEVSFQPQVRTEAKIGVTGLGYAEAVISGPIRFNSQVTVQATAGAFY